MRLAYRGSEWRPARCEWAGLSALFVVYRRLTQADGLGWYGGAPLALGAADIASKVSLYYRWR